MNLRDAIETCYLKNLKKLPYAISLDEEEYVRKVNVLRNELPNMVKKDYICYCHKHEDIYIHTTSIEKAEIIKENGYLDINLFSENGSVGRAIYTYPLNSGRCMYDEESVIIKFKSNEMHYHIVGANDSIHCLGECIFVDRKNLELQDLELLSVEEYKNLVGRYVSKSDLIHYFGMPEHELTKLGVDEINVESLREFIEKDWDTPYFEDSFYRQWIREFVNPEGDNPRILKKISEKEFDVSSIGTTSLF